MKEDLHRLALNNRSFIIIVGGGVHKKNFKKRYYLYEENNIISRHSFFISLKYSTERQGCVLRGYLPPVRYAKN